MIAEVLSTVGEGREKGQDQNSFNLSRDMPAEHEVSRGFISLVKSSGEKVIDAVFSPPSVGVSNIVVVRRNWYFKRIEFIILILPSFPPVRASEITSFKLLLLFSGPAFSFS